VKWNPSFVTRWSISWSENFLACSKYIDIGHVSSDWFLIPYPSCTLLNRQAEIYPGSAL